jgi:dipeptidyl aminopeptidase/acylaminoacyl peptidase
VKPAGYAQGKRYPLIVTLYRSGDYFLLGASGNENPIQVYAAHGFAVLSFDVGRNRIRKDGHFESHLLDWASPTASLEMAVQSLVDRGIVDATKVGLTGLSHGAETSNTPSATRTCFKPRSKAGQVRVILISSIWQREAGTDSLRNGDWADGRKESRRRIGRNSLHR